MIHIFKKEELVRSLADQLETAGWQLIDGKLPLAITHHAEGRLESYGVKSTAVEFELIGTPGDRRSPQPTGHVQGSPGLHAKRGVGAKFNG